LIKVVSRIRPAIAPTRLNRLHLTILSVAATGLALNALML
jgi:hypothetical protein